MGHRFQIVVVVIGLIASLAQAQGGNTLFGLTGAVQDSSGAVIVGANVALVAHDGTVVAEAATDSSGNFALAKVGAGDYTVDVTQAGFQEVKRAVKAGVGMQRQMLVVLPVSSVNEEVTVSGSGTAAQVSTEVLQNQNANSVDRDALDSSCGATATSHAA